jgi:hypothetical protein
MASRSSIFLPVIPVSQAKNRFTAEPPSFSDLNLRAACAPRMARDGRSVCPLPTGRSFAGPGQAAHDTGLDGELRRGSAAGLGHVPGVELSLEQQVPGGAPVAQSDNRSGHVALQTTPIAESLSLSGPVVIETVKGNEP